MKVASQHERTLLGYPNVIAVGAGPERKKGRITGEAAIVITVRRKRTRDELAAACERELPSLLGGIAVDVIELGKPVEAPENRLPCPP